MRNGLKVPAMLANMSVLNRLAVWEKTLLIAIYARWLVWEGVSKALGLIGWRKAKLRQTGLCYARRFVIGL